MNLLEKLGEQGTIPAAKIEHCGQAAALAEALLKGDLHCAEITFRKQPAEESINEVFETQPKMLVGSSTVPTTPQARLVVTSGAHFIVSSGFIARAACQIGGDT